MVELLESKPKLTYYHSEYRVITEYVNIPLYFNNEFSQNFTTIYLDEAKFKQLLEFAMINDSIISEFSFNYMAKCELLAGSEAL